MLFCGGVDDVAAVASGEVINEAPEHRAHHKEARAHSKRRTYYKLKFVK